MRSYNQLTQAVLRRPVELGVCANAVVVDMRLADDTVTASDHS
jgi:hypothetical protein